MWKQKLKIVVWAMLGLSCIALMAASIKKKNSDVCSGVNINISGATEHVFVKKDEVLKVLSNYHAVKGSELLSVNLKGMEAQIRKNAWIKNAELYFDNNNILNVKITEKQPVARVFTISGKSFYIDSSGLRLPTKKDASARVMVFTSFPSDNVKLSKPDSAVLKDIKTLANYINADSFFKAQTSQVNINSDGTYDMLPVLGNQVIKLGNTDDIENKFARLLAFYQQVWTKAGFEKYSKIDLQYSGQVVAERRDGKSVNDSLAAVENISANAKNNQLLHDTLYNHSSIQTASYTPQKIALQKPVVHKNQEAKKKAVIKKAETNKDKRINNSEPVLQQQPKAVMQKKVVAD